jgi:hypothetical protein
MGSDEFAESGSISELRFNCGYASGHSKFSDSEISFLER